MRLIAKTETNAQADDGIEFFVIESDEENTGGFFVFLHRSLDSPSEADMWFSTLEEAKRQASYSHGIAESDWVPQTAETY